MKKRNLFLFGLAVFALTIISCEEDDVCLGSESTPNLTMVFRSNYTQNNQPDSLYISVLDATHENAYLLYDGIYSDSLQVPLGGLGNSVSYFEIKRKKFGTPDTLTVNYGTKTKYVSKACGFKVIYDQLNFSTTYNDIESILPNVTNNIENEANSNLYIYYSN